MIKNSTFANDTILIGEKLEIPLDETNLKVESLNAVFLPYYLSPISSELSVVLKRSIMPGQFFRTGSKMGLSALEVELPMDNPITIEQAFELLELNTNIVNAIPFGCVMPDPTNSTKAYELVLVNIEPLTLKHESSGIFFQKEGEYEIGVSEFRALLPAIQHNAVTDLKTRILLNELYIMALEEATILKQDNTSNSNVIGGGYNHPSEFENSNDFNDVMKTGNITDEIIKQQSRLDQGAMYAVKSANTFKSIAKE